MAHGSEGIGLFYGISLLRFMAESPGIHPAPATDFLSISTADPARPISTAAVADESSPTNPFCYRPDIDGLRALAILLVLFFHFDFGFTGGYVGVDVFFVISGYLITGLMLRDLDRGTFSLARFWLRRVWRIAPASSVMVLATLLVGAQLLIPGDYEDLGTSALTHVVMASNVYFWKHSGYFAGDAELNPLLHTWSLAIEEQFYLVYPLILALLYRPNRAVLRVILIGLTVLSLGCSEWQLQTDPNAAFFLLPSRCWELLAGGLIWFLGYRRWQPDWMNEGLAAGGLGFILTAAWWYDSDTRFPGATALLPVLGTAVLIASNSSRLTLIGRALAWGPCRGLGLISYSVYLWHWPILVFLKYRYGEELDLPTRLTALGGSILCGFVSWRLIEVPLRAGTGPITLPMKWAFLASSVAAGIGLAAVATQFDGYPAAITPGALPLLEAMEQGNFRHEVSLEEVQAGDLPMFGDPEGNYRCLVWGDSHAMAVLPAIDSVCDRLHIRGYQATHSATLPLIDFDHDSRMAAPPEFNRRVIDFVTEHDIDIVVLVGYWSREAERKDFRGCFMETIRELDDRDIPILLLTNIPDQRADPRQTICTAILRGTPLDQLGILSHEHDQEQVEINRFFAENAGDQVQILDPAPYLTDAAGRCRIVMDGQPLYWDNDHLTVAGALRLEPLFDRALTKAVEQTAAVRD